MVNYYLSIKKGSNIKKVEGIDSETYKGNIFLLTFTEGKQIKHIWFNPFSRNYATDLFTVFVTLKNRNYFFHNLEFDISSFLKICFTQDEITELLITGNVQKEDFTFNYLNQKFFSIVDKKRKINIKFWDSNNIFKSSLDRISKELLGKGKEASDLNLYRFDDWNYILDNKDKIIHYGKIDSLRVKQIMEKLITELSNNSNSNNSTTKYPFFVNKPYSTASISALNFKINTKYPNYRRIVNKKWNKLIDTDKMENYVMNTYRGGIFDSFQKGFIDDKLYKVDLKSAYPFFTANLNDLNFAVPLTTKEYLPEYEYGCYLCSIETEIPIKPFKDIKLQNGLSIKNLLLTGQIPKVYLLPEEIKFLEDNNQTVNIHSGFVLHFNEIHKPLKNFVEFLFSEKERLKKENPLMSNINKICLNSNYGKNWEQIKKVKKITDKEYCFLCHKYIDDIFDHTKNEHSDKYFVLNNQEYIKYIEKGQMFNPFYASKITAGTRLKVLGEYIKQPQNTLSINTDDIILTEKPKNLNFGSKLGDWEQDIYEYGVYLGNGFYDFFGENNLFSFQDNFKPLLKKRRGCETGIGLTVEDIEFKLSQNMYITKGFSLIDKLNTIKKQFQVYLYTPISLKTVRKQIYKYNWIDINQFKIIEKRININFNKKMIWDKELNGKQIIQDQEIVKGQIMDFDEHLR